MSKVLLGFFLGMAFVFGVETYLHRTDAHYDHLTLQSATYLFEDLDEVTLDGKPLRRVDLLDGMLYDYVEMKKQE